MKSLSRIMAIVVVTSALAAGVALADDPDHSPATVVSSNSSDQPASSVLATEDASTSTVGQPAAAPQAGAPQPAAPDGSSVIATGGQAAAVAGTDACAQIAAEQDSINGTFDLVEEQLAGVLPPGTLDAVIAVLEASRDRVIADLDAALAACESATSTSSTSTSSTTSTTAAPSPSCADLASQRAAANATFDAAEAELTSIITGNELLTAIASLEAARAQTNAGIDAAIAACASASSSTSSTTPTTNVPAASCAEIRTDRTAFNTQLDAVEAQLRTVLAASSEQLATAISGIEAQRALGNGKFDAALAKC
jgi:hypothetical protein